MSDTGIPDVMQGELTTLRLTWVEEKTRDPLDLSGYTLSGIIEMGQSPNWTTKAITGTLSVVNATAGIFDWVLSAGDVDTYGVHGVVFEAKDGGGVVRNRSVRHPWEVHRMPGA